MKIQTPHPGYPFGLILCIQNDKISATLNTLFDKSML